MHRRLTAVCLLALLVLAASPAPAAPIAHREVLPNGTVLLVAERPAVPIVAVRVFMRAGSVFDPQDRGGLAKPDGLAPHAGYGQAQRDDTVTCRVSRSLVSPTTVGSLPGHRRRTRARLPRQRLFDAHRDNPEFGYRFLVDEAREAGEPMAERTAWRICSQLGWWSGSASPSGARRRSPGHRSTTTCAPWSTTRAGSGTSSMPMPRTSCGSPTSPSTAPGGQALRLRDQGRLLQPDRGLLHRLENEVQAGRRGPQQRGRQAR